MDSPKNAASAAGNGGSDNRELVQRRLVKVLSKWFGPRANVQGREPLRLGGQLWLPDVAVYDAKFGLRAANLAGASDTPLLAVIVLDAAAPFGPQVAAARQLVAAGVPSCWLVEPTLGTVTVATEPGSYRSFNRHETLRDPATGLELELSDLFG